MRLIVISLISLTFSLGCGEYLKRDTDTAVEVDADAVADADADAVADADADADADEGGVDDYEGDSVGECSDGTDNDRDGLFDCDDPGCVGSPDCAQGDAASCRFGPTLCIEPNEPDNLSRCEYNDGIASFDSCPSGANGMCEIPAGGLDGVYTRMATVYYYNNLDGSAPCRSVGGTYTSL